jgi:hypothetical protein
MLEVNAWLSHLSSEIWDTGFRGSAGTLQIYMVVRYS